MGQYGGWALPCLIPCCKLHSNHGFINAIELFIERAPVTLATVGATDLACGLLRLLPPAAEVLFQCTHRHRKCPSSGSVSSKCLWASECGEGDQSKARVLLFLEVRLLLLNAHKKHLPHPSIMKTVLPTTDLRQWTCVQITISFLDQH
jgi:hypothetical protein